MATDAAGLGTRRAAAFVAPAMILIAAFLLVPAVWMIGLSVTNYRLSGLAAAHPRWVGGRNYTDTVDNSAFHHSLWITVLFVFGSAVIGQSVLGFVLAWSLRNVVKAVRGVIEMFVLLAWILPGSVVAFLWLSLLDRTNGTLNHVFGWFGLNPHAWLLDHPMGCLIVFNTWRGTAFSMMLFSAALQAVPPSQLETARMAGAGVWAELRDVVFPHIRGHILTNTLLISLWTFNDFTPYMITKGGPEHRSETLPGYIYAHAINGGELGAGAAVSVIMLVINLVIALFYLRLLRERSGGRKKRAAAADDTQGPPALPPTVAAPVGVQKGVGA
jgi:multiple sugar transport system permease protein